MSAPKITLKSAIPADLRQWGEAIAGRDRCGDALEVVQIWDAETAGVGVVWCSWGLGRPVVVWPSDGGGSGDGGGVAFLSRDPKVVGVMQLLIASQTKPETIETINMAELAEWMRD